MAKARTYFVCRSCGGAQARWMGKCPDCGTWDSLEKFVEPKVSAAAAPLVQGGTAWSVSGRTEERSEPFASDPSESDAAGGAGAPIARPLPEIESHSFARTSTGIAEFDRVLGGGLVAGSAVLLGGDPGIGKSTLLLQAAGHLARAGTRVLYVSSEESAYQVRLRAERLLELEHGREHGPASKRSVKPSPDKGLHDLFVLADTNLARIIEQAARVQPGVMVLDSIQMVFRSDLPASPGSVTQLRRCAMELVTLAKATGMAVILVGHVTKDGHLAGPKLLEHLVDTVLSFEGDRHHAHRMVRSIKNRFGTTLEVGLFEMSGAGLMEVEAGVLRLDPTQPPRAGSVVCPAMHGSRCLLVELQALTAMGFPGSTRRKVSGVDLNRVNMLLAVLEKHGRMRLSDQDVYVSAVGGLRVTEPAADLGIALAVAGAARGAALAPGIAVIGEVGLGGEIRAVSHGEQRLKEAARLGYRTVLIPRDLRGSAEGVRGLRVEIAATVGEAMERLEARD